MTSRSGLAKSLEDEVKARQGKGQRTADHRDSEPAEAGSKVADLCHKQGINQRTFYQWRNKYGGMGVNEPKRLKEAGEQNRRLRKFVVDQALDLSALIEALHQKW
jgi:putative transposase